MSRRFIYNNHNVVTNKNLIDYSSWQTDSLGSCGVANTNNYFVEYTVGGVGTNVRVTGTTMLNTQDAIWLYTGNTLTGNSYGGFNMTEGQFQQIRIDNTKNYRFSIWLNKKVVTGTGNIYFGVWGNLSGSSTGQSLINNVTGAANKNQYFLSTAPTQTNVIAPQNEWRLLVGTLRAVGTATGSTNNSYSGIYTLSGVKMTTGFTLADITMTSSVSGVTMKVAAPFNSVGGAEAYFLYPRIDLMDGNEPTIEYLLHNE